MYHNAKLCILYENIVPKTVMKLNIFADSRYVPPGVMSVPILAPFLGKTQLETSQLNLQSGRLDNYLTIAHELFKVVNWEEADLAIYPGYWQMCRFPEAQSLLIELAQKAREKNIPLAVFVGGDLPEDVPVEDAFIFHTSLYHSRRKLNAFAMPALIQDLVSKYLDGKLVIREKRAKPTVGFCGHAPPLSMAWNREKVKESVRLGLSYLGVTKLVPERAAHCARVKALLSLQKSKLVNSNFQLRHRSGMVWAYGYLLPQEKVNHQQQRKDFINNLVSSDYILCARGYGNYSVRLYEALCCGRIPVFVNTDCVLPYDFSQDWRQYCVWVEEKDLPRIGEKVAEFHNQLSPSEFIDLQYACRNFWQEWLSPEGFFSNFYRHFPT